MTMVHDPSPQSPKRTETGAARSRADEGPRTRYRRALATLEALIFRMVEEASRSTPPPNTLLGALFNMPTGSESLTTAEINDELKAFLVAGHTTTASALAWTW